ncbi:hypothetical protein N656DRAFT_772435 [Canariomyces notabilis]|uniref:Uncharacterized protein n=1 Tax=Canariomyces notabilis TaxID=2074819 RepID=A0AAN6T733_9PEZI|nr:hypothetical protein N656DRAFT_772435 [Canariomyces arenarius]
MEREAFYRRAVADASSLTQAEINLIFGWVSPEEDEQICRANANGKTRAELIAIAATNPEQLTKVESELVQRSQALLTDLRREATNPIHNLPPGLKTLDELAARAQIVMEEALSWNRDPLREEAYQAVWNALDDQERRAIIAAQNRLMQIMDEELAEEERKYPRRMQQPELPEGYVRD